MSWNWLDTPNLSHRPSSLCAMATSTSTPPWIWTATGYVSLWREKPYSTLLSVGLAHHLRKHSLMPHSTWQYKYHIIHLAPYILVIIQEQHTEWFCTTQTKYYYSSNRELNNIQIYTSQRERERERERENFIDEGSGVDTWSFYIQHSSVRD